MTDIAKAKSVVEWQEAKNATGYMIRYAKGCSVRGACEPWTTEDPIVGATNTSITLEDLDPDNLYLVEVWSTRGSKESDKVRVYTYPTREALPRHTASIELNRLTKVGSIPIAGYRPGGRYTYTLCNTSLSDTQEQQIEDGIAEWGEVTGMVTYVQSPGSCTGNGSKVSLEDENGMHLGGCGFDDVACAVHDPKPEEVPLGRLKMTSIFIYENASTTVGSVTFGGSCSELFQLAMHEAGHAYGLHDAHRALTGLVMGALYDNCSPSQQDIAALKAIYQSR